MTGELTVERVQEMVTRAPYHRWLGLKVVAVEEDGIELKATWREEWVVNPDRRYTHGGVLATLIDLGLREKAILVAILVPIVWIGVYPKPFLGRLHASVIELVERVERGAAPATAGAPAAEPRS